MQGGGPATEAGFRIPLGNQLEIETTKEMGLYIKPAVNVFIVASCAAIVHIVTRTKTLKIFQEILF